jgi:hypothetical protein
LENATQEDWSSRRIDIKFVSRLSESARASERLSIAEMARAWGTLETPSHQEQLDQELAAAMERIGGTNQI